jgi:hypothetical protein
MRVELCGSSPARLCTAIPIGRTSRRRVEEDTPCTAAASAGRSWRTKAIASCPEAARPGPRAQPRANLAGAADSRDARRSNRAFSMHR